jgi:hypothetical protein
MDCGYGMLDACNSVLACQTVECWLKDNQNSGCTLDAIQAYQVCSRVKVMLIVAYHIGSIVLCFKISEG